MQTEKLSPAQKVLYTIGTTFLLGIMGAVGTASANPYIIDDAGNAMVRAMVTDNSIPTSVWAFEGYGDSCHIERWDIPSQYDGVQHWKSSDPGNAKPYSIEKAEDPKACSKNFNPENASVPLTGLQYGSVFGLRPEHHVGVSFESLV